MLIKQICNIVNGSTPSTSCPEFWDGNISWITPKDMSLQMKRYISKGERNITEKGYNSCSTTLVPRNTILLTSRAPIGYISIAENELCTNQGFKSLVCGDKVLPLFMYYWLATKVDLLKSISNGATFKELSKQALENVEIDLPNLEIQQHIVDTIGSVDDLIEKIEEKLNKIKEYGGLIFNKTIDCDLIDLLKIAKFEKGKEIGSANYLDKQKTNSVPYIRVGNLLNGEYDTYVVNSDCPQCDYEDILIAFDGAPGRNIIGLKGCYSSGVQKVVCDKENKGYIYFYINSELCQNTIKVHSQGTTILHASKSIKELKIPIISSNNKNLLNSLFNEMVSLIKQKKKLKKEKDLLLKKYFG